jgi:N-dimethylarginine dimethylaminohydrolase
MHLSTVFGALTDGHALVYEEAIEPFAPVF